MTDDIQADEALPADTPLVGDELPEDGDPDFDPDKVWDDEPVDDVDDEDGADVVDEVGVQE